MNKSYIEDLFHNVRLAHLDLVAEFDRQGEDALILEANETFKIVERWKDSVLEYVNKNYE